MIDTTTEFGAQVSRRLQSEAIAWLTTVARDGTPQPNPVWFYWDGESFLIYTQPSSSKLKNIARNPRVSINLQEATEEGENVVVVVGEATVQAEATIPDPGYVAKYAQTIERLGQTVEGLAASYCVTIRVKPKKIRGF